MCRRITVLPRLSCSSSPLLSERTEASERCWCCWANQRSLPVCRAGGALTATPPSNPALLTSTRQRPPIQSMQLTPNVNGDRWCCAAGIRQYNKQIHTAHFPTPPPPPPPVPFCHFLVLAQTGVQHYNAEFYLHLLHLCGFNSLLCKNIS